MDVDRFGMPNLKWGLDLPPASTLGSSGPVTVVVFPSVRGVGRAG